MLWDQKKSVSKWSGIWGTVNWIKWNEYETLDYNNELWYQVWTGYTNLSRSILNLTCQQFVLVNIKHYLDQTCACACILEMSLEKLIH